jgi:hypothetical protein
MPFVPGTSYTLAILGANGVTDKFFLAFLFNNSDVLVQFLKDVGLLRGSIVFSKCGFLISWCVAANCDLSLQPDGGLLVHYMFWGGGAFTKTFKRYIVIVVSIDCKVSTLLQPDADATQLLVAPSCQSPHNTAKPFLNW